MKEMDRDFVIQEIYKNRNHSWYEEFCERNKYNADKVALTFRENKITYGEFIEEVIKYSKALKQYGIKKGDEFVACLRQTPDYPILFAAATLIGAKINLVSSSFANLDDIINKANSDVVFVNDWDFSTIAPVLKECTQDKKIITIPVSKWDKYNNPYAKITNQFYIFDENEYKASTNSFNNVVDIDDFLLDGENYNGELNGRGTLDDEVAITYTSGSTKKGYHKGVPQRNKSYIVMGRYHDPEVVGIPKMKRTVSFFAIPTHTDTLLMTGVSDTLLQGGTVALDPIIDEKYFIYSLLFNKAGLAFGTRTYWLRAMKDTYEIEDLKNIKLPYMYVPSEGGEPLSAGEEKALNKWLKDVKAGTKITHTPFSVAKMTVGGGDSENGSIFLSLYRDYKNPIQKIKGIDEPIGLWYYNFADVEVMREDGTFCKPMEMGRLITNSPIAMEKYHNDPEETKKHFIKDSTGKSWANLNCYGYKDKDNYVYMKGRIGVNDPKIKTFQIADEILKDTKNIMSCEVINFEDEFGESIYVAHIETQYHKMVNLEKTLLSAEQRVKNKFGDLLNDRVLFRIHTHEEGFPTSFTAKRYNIALKEEGISDLCIIPSKYYLKDEKSKVKTLIKN